MNPRILAPSVLICALATQYALAVCPPAPDQLQPGDRAADEEVKRIQWCLDEHSRKRDEGEQWLYTWGHRDKILRMRTMETSLFHYFENSRQRKAEEIAAVSYFKLSKSDIKISRRLDEELVDLKAVDRRAKDHPDEKALLHAVAINKIYPDYLRDYHKTSGDRLQSVTKELAKSDLDPVRKASLEGELVAIRSAQDRSKTSFPFTTTGGLGVYFGTDPVEFVSHFKGAGLRCRVPWGKRIVDVTHGSDQLEPLREAEIVLFHDTNVSQFFNPTLYNNLTRPLQFEHAATGFILRITSIKNLIAYVSKGAIDYVSNCEEITLYDLRTCAHLAVVNNNAELRNYLGSSILAPDVALSVLSENCELEKAGKLASPHAPHGANSSTLIPPGSSNDGSSVGSDTLYGAGTDGAGVSSGGLSDADSDASGVSSGRTAEPPLSRLPGL